jgi:hypothetical protein
MLQVLEVPTNSCGPFTALVLRTFSLMEATLVRLVTATTAFTAICLLSGCSPSGASPNTPLTPATATEAPNPTDAPTREPTQTLEPVPTRTLAPGETPDPTPIDLSPFLTAELTVLNLDEAALAVTVTILDPESTEEYEVTKIDVAPLQLTAQSVLPARYRLEFDYPGTSATAGTCVIDVAEKEKVQFAMLARGGVITTDTEPDDAADMDIATSARCRAGVAP